MRKFAYLGGNPSGIDKRLPYICISFACSDPTLINQSIMKESSIIIASQNFIRGTAVHLQINIGPEGKTTEISTVVLEFSRLSIRWI